MFKNRTILITGGTGFIGQALTAELLKHDPKKIIIFSRSEYKQHLMQTQFNNDRLRFFIGDVRDYSRLAMALKDVDFVCHAAALKRIDQMEYCPDECIKTNVNGSANIMRAAIWNGVKKVIAISTDKAVQPLNLYGSSKLCMEKLIINGNALSGNKTLFSVVRYGNVEGSTGSVIPFFQALLNDGKRILPLTDERMTRFHITASQAVNLILNSFKIMRGGEVFIPKIPSFRIVDLIKSMNCKPHIIGKRPGEKLNEIMITTDDASRTYENKDYYIIYPEYDWTSKRKFKGKKVKEGFSYSSDINKEWLYK